MRSWDKKWKEIKDEREKREVYILTKATLTTDDLCKAAF